MPEATVHLFDNTPSGWIADNWAGANYTDGNNFYAPTGGEVTHFRWYSRTGGAAKPSALSLWDRFTQTRVAIVTSIPDPTTAGWKEVALGTPYPLVSNRVYTVALEWGNTTDVSYQAYSSRQDPPNGLEWADPSHAVANGLNTYPSGTNTVLIRPVDVTWVGEVSAPGGGEIETIVEQALTRWFDSSGDNTRQTELPWLTKVLLGDVDTKVDAMRAVVDDALATIDAAMGPGGTLVTGSVRAALDVIFGKVSDESTETQTTIMGPGNPTIADVMGAIAALSPGGGSTLPPFTVGSADYTQTAQTTGQGSFEWIQPADAYSILFEDVAETGRTVRDVGGVNIFWARAWAKPWDGVRMYPHHIDFSGPLAVIMSDRRWPGLIVWLPPDVEWTVTAFDVS